MGAWGIGPFDNDDAGDWAYDVVESDDLSVVEAAINEIASAQGAYLESPDCCNALAAAELVAAMLGKPSDSLPEELAQWISGRPAPPSSTVKNAQEAVSAILAASELRELWEETDDYEQWTAITRDLLRRLG